MNVGEILAADFLLALGEDDDVDRQLAARREMRLERLHVEEELAFVVDRAARKDLSVADRRLERRAVPEIERLGGLHVVVAVDENRLARPRRARATRRRRSDGPSSDGPWPSRPTLRSESRDPLGGARRVGVVLGARADARNAEEVEELVARARLVRGEERFEVVGEWHSHKLAPPRRPRNSPPNAPGRKKIP